MAAIRSTLEIIDGIHQEMMLLASTHWEHRTFAEFLELLEEGEEWVQKMRNFLRGSEDED